MGTSKKTILDVYIGWETDGSIQFDIHNHSELPDDEVIRKLSLCIPIVVNHELGEMNFQQALSLCDSLLDFLSSENIPTKSIELDFSGLHIACYEFNRVNLSYIPELEYTERNEDIDRGIKNVILNLTKSILDISTPELGRIIRDYLLVTMHNFFLVVLPTVMKEDDRKYSNNTFEIRIKKDSFHQSLCMKLANPRLLTTREFNSLLEQTRLAHGGYKDGGTKPSELMDDYEKWEFTRDYLLPALEKEMLNELESQQKRPLNIPAANVPDGALTDNLNDSDLASNQPHTCTDRVIGTTSAADKQTMNYMFAHIIFPLICHGNKKEVYRRLSRSNANDYLVELWKATENKLGKAAEHDGLYLIKETKLDDTKRVFIINMPEPSLVPEAFLVGVAMETSKSFMSLQVKNIRYFTLELGMVSSEGPPELYFCEWVGIVNPTHKNHGRVKNPSSEIFISRIRDIF